MLAESIEERLVRSERTSRHYRSVLAGMGIAILAGTITWGVAGATGCAHATKVIRADRFVLVDANGKTRAELGMSKDGPGLWLYDENGNVRTMLEVREGKGAGLTLVDDNCRAGARLDVNKDGAGLVMCDVYGKTRVGLMALDVGPGLALYDQQGKAIWRAP